MIFEECNRNIESIGVIDPSAITIFREESQVIYYKDVSVPLLIEDRIIDDTFL